jgi:FKBP-type peptidyl-prolyl cis-trans isomerase 2
MSRAKNGDTVRVHYTGKLENGEVFATSEDGQPLEFTVGSGKVIPGFEKSIIDMESGDTRTVTVPPEEGFGERCEELVVDVQRSKLPEEVEPAVGEQLKSHDASGNVMTMIVTDVDEDTVTLDANHPLAGRTLTFTIELIDII